MSDTPKVAGSPGVIYLVYGDLEHDDTHDNMVYESRGEVTWCPIQQFQSDVRYARMDILMEARKECAELRKELAEFDPHRKLHALEKDCITMALRLLGDDESTFSPETIEVMNRWKPKIRELLK